MSLKLGTDTINGLARAKALESSDKIQAVPAALISYKSSGSVYVLGNDASAREAAAKLAENVALEVTLVVIDHDVDIPYIKLESIGSNESAKPTELSATIQGTINTISGYLGHFDLLLETSQGKAALSEVLGRPQDDIDIVLDLTNVKFISSEVKPPGYYYAGADDLLLQQALDEIPELVGEFEKPQYYNYNPDICAHSRSHIKACTRCIEACPTDAISSIGDTISVNANLCQGAGVCATACPTGAISYSYPQLKDNLQRLHLMLNAYRQAGGRDAVILFHDATAGRDAIEYYANRIPDNVIPIEVEELGAMGMDGWLACLSYGASAVLLLAMEDIPKAVLKEIRAQLSYAGAILKGMGFPSGVLQLVYNSPENFTALFDKQQSLQDVPAAKFFESNDKRKIIRAAVDHLYQYASTPRPLISLPTGAPFGEVWLDTKRCTLCMSCVWQCPGRALIAGGNQPQLKFVENDCVQCGLCARTCPEDAIGPSPRYLYDKEQRITLRVLYEEEPFLCIKCGKAFASQRVIAQMTAKLQKHDMFQGDALKRIQMCEDCRVKDIFAAELKQDQKNARKELS